MVHVVNAPGGDYWTVALLSVPDWQAAMDGASEGHMLHRAQMTLWSHPASEGGGPICFASDDDAWQALRRNWPELARPVLPRMAVYEHNRQDEPTERSLLLPGSAEWMHELARVNPLQAAYTAAVFDSAGTTRCCLVCGDTDEVHDYLITSPDCAHMLARFCDDCRAIQAAMYDLRTGPALPLPPDEAVP
jgi:hypothetical protein